MKNCVIGFCFCIIATSQLFGMSTANTIQINFWETDGYPKAGFTIKHRFDLTLDQASSSLEIEELRAEANRLHLLQNPIHRLAEYAVDSGFDDLDRRFKLFPRFRKAYIKTIDDFFFADMFEELTFNDQYALEYDANLHAFIKKDGGESYPLGDFVRETYRHQFSQSSVFP